MIRRPPRSTRTDTLFPYTTLFRSQQLLGRLAVHFNFDQGIELGEALQDPRQKTHHRSEEHTSELQSLMRISYAVFCLKKKKKKTNMYTQQTNNKNNNIKIKTSRTFHLCIISNLNQQHAQSNY